MAGHYRQIHTKIWKDGWFLDLEPDLKLLFIYLFSNDRTNITGLYDIPLKVIAFETDLSMDRVKEGLQQFCDDGKVVYEDGWIWIPSLFRYNAENVASPKIQAHVRNTLAEIPNIPLKQRWIEYHSDSAQSEYHTDTISIPIPHEPEHEHEHEPEQEHDTIGANAPPGNGSPPKKARMPRKPKEPAPVAVERFREVTERYPHHGLWPDIQSVVGESPPDLERWQRVVKAWLAMGWNPTNVKGMLQHFHDKRIPGDDMKARGSPGGVPEPASYAALRALAQEEGFDWQH